MQRYDDFNRPDSATSLGSPSDGGTPWQALRSTWGLTGGQAYTPQYVLFGAAVLDAQAADVAVQATLSHGTGEAGVCARMTDSNNGFFWLCKDNYLRLYRLQAGTLTAIDGGSVPVTVGPGDVFELVCQGSQLTGYLNGVAKVGPITDTFNRGATLHGICVNDLPWIYVDTFSCTPGGIAVTAPVANQFYWRGKTGQATFTLAGTYLGSNPPAIEWSSDGVTWQTLQNGPTGGTFSGSVTLPTGQYTLQVRRSDNHGVLASIGPLSVAYVFAVAGQSNASGRGTNNQTVYDANGLTHALKTYTGYAPLADPYAVTVDSSSAGSFVPPMVTALAARLEAPIGVVPTAQGGTSVTQWQAGGQNYSYLVSAVRTVGGCDGVLWWQGESDAAAGMLQATYHSDFAAFVASVQTDLGCPVLPYQLETQDASSATLARQQAVNAAIAQAWGDVAGCLPGPNLTPLPSDPESPYHLMTDEKLCQAGALWAGAIRHSLFPGA